jgi:hypothetical protein
LTLSLIATRFRFRGQCRGRSDPARRHRAAVRARPRLGKKARTLTRPERPPPVARGSTCKRDSGLPAVGATLVVARFAPPHVATGRPQGSRLHHQYLSPFTMLRPLQFGGRGD